MGDPTDIGRDRTPPGTAADGRIAAAAAAWIARRDRGLTPAEELTLRTWEQADRRHAAELARMGGTWRGLDRLPGDAALEAMAEAVVARARARRRRRQWINFAAATSLAAAAVVALGLWHSRPLPPGAPAGLPPATVKVIASSVNRLTLPDGSVAELNGNSRLELDYSAAERRVRLIEGEAHFIVAPNPDRPFFVTAGTVTVRAVGTAFNVRLASAAIEVLVTEGRVQLENALPPPAAPASARPGVETAPAPRDFASSPALVAGQRAIIDRAAAEPAMAIGDVGPSEMNEALGWQGTRLVFSNTPLDEVVASFNRYNRHRLSLGDPQLRTRTLTGVFRADNLEGFVRLLRASVDVAADRRGPTDTVLLPAR